MISDNVRNRIHHQIAYYYRCLNNASEFDEFCRIFVETMTKATGHTIRFDDVPRATLKERMREQIKILEAVLSKQPRVSNDSQDYN